MRSIVANSHRNGGIAKKTQLIAGGIAYTAGKDENASASTLINAATKRCAHARRGEKNWNHRGARKVCIIKL